VIGFWAGPNPSLVLFALTTILASGATIGTQIGAAIVFILATLAVVELVLVSNLVTPTKTQALLRTLHDWARAIANRSWWRCSPWLGSRWWPRARAACEPAAATGRRGHF
jgi:hypothetical protein